MISSAQCLEECCVELDGEPPLQRLVPCISEVYSKLREFINESADDGKKPIGALALVEMMADGSIDVVLKRSYSEKGGFLAFKIYDDLHVADNGAFIRKSGGMTPDYNALRQKIESMNLGPFHNPFLAYVDMRWEEHKKKNGFFPYNKE